MKAARQVALVVAVGLAAPAVAWANGLPTPGVEMLAPSDGQTLVAGDVVELAWRPTPGSPAAEEWEAFLSVDGGRTWPIRLTPHLDWQHRRFGFRIPAMPSEHVRLLLRVGNEHEEVAIATGLSLRIVAADAPPPLATTTRLSLAAGESALPGQPGVSQWVDGPRDGSRPVEVAAPVATGLLPAGPSLGLPIASEPVEDPVPPAKPGAPRAVLLARLPPTSAIRPRITGATRPAGRTLRSLLAQRNE